MTRRAISLSLLLLVGMVETAGAQEVKTPTSGEVRVIRFRSAALARERQVHIYLPPGYQKAKARRYPVIYALHGLGGSDRDFFRAGQLNRFLDTRIGSGVMPPAIVVAPDGGNGYWTNHYRRRRSRYGDFVARDVVKEADTRFRTIAKREARAIVGVSMGGHGAFSLALRHPEVFGVAISLSGALFPSAPTHRKLYGRVWGSPPNAKHWRRTSPIALMRRLPGKGPVPALYIHCGDRDGLKFFKYARLAARILKRRKVPYTFSRTRGGRHSWRVWRAETPAWLGYLAGHWKAFK